MVIEYLPTFTPYLCPSFVGQYSSTMVRIWVLFRMNPAPGPPGLFLVDRYPNQRTPGHPLTIVFFGSGKRLVVNAYIGIHSG